MKPETIAIHGGYEVDPTTKAVAVPIYQTVSYAFDSADHAAALFNLEAEGFRYTRIQNPTTAVLERRVAALEGGLEAMCVEQRSGRGQLRRAERRGVGFAISSRVPQLYGTTHTLFAHILPSQGITVRFARTTARKRSLALIDDKTRAVFCESVGNPAGNICDIEGLARVAHDHGVPLIVDNTVATPILLRPIEYGADIVVHSLTKFLGGHGTTLGRRHRRQRQLRLEGATPRASLFSASPMLPITAWSTPSTSAKTAYIARCRSVYLRTGARCSRR